MGIEQDFVREVAPRVVTEVANRLIPIGKTLGSVSIDELDREDAKAERAANRTWVDDVPKALVWGGLSFAAGALLGFLKS